MGVQQILVVMALLFLRTAAQAQERVVAYVPNWIDLPTFAETIDYSKVTHLNIAFENPTNDRGDLSFNRKNETLLTHARRTASQFSFQSAAARRRKTRCCLRDMLGCSQTPTGQALWRS
jgi:GH18 family chitinase